MADAEKQDREARSSKVRFFLLSCMTVALLSLCICVVVFERDTFLPTRYNNVVVVDYADYDVKAESRAIDDSANSVRVDFESLEAGGEAAFNAMMRNIAAGTNGNVADNNAVPAFVDGVKLQDVYDVSPSSFKISQVGQLGVLLQAMMKQRREEVAAKDVVPLLSEADDSVDLVLVMSQPAPPPNRPNGFPQDVLDSFVRRNYRQPIPAGQRDSLLPTFQQRMEDARRMMASVQRDQLARMRQEQVDRRRQEPSFFEEQSRPMSEDVRAAIEQDLSKYRGVFEVEPSREQHVSFINRMLEQRVAEGARNVDPVQVVSIVGAREPIVEVVPVIQIRYEEANNATLRASAGGEKSEKGASSDLAVDEMEGSATSGSVEKSELNDSSFFDDSVSEESREQAENILEGRVEQLLILPAEEAQAKTESTTGQADVNVSEGDVIIPAVQTEVKTESTTGHSEVNAAEVQTEQILMMPALRAEVKADSTGHSHVNVEVTNVEPIPAPPAKKHSFLDELIKGISEKARSIIKG